MNILESNKEILEDLRQWAGKEKIAAIAQRLQVDIDLLRKIAERARISIKYKDPALDRRDEFVKANHSSMTAREMARTLKTKINSIYSIASRLGVECVEAAPVKEKEPELIMETEDGYFNEHAHETWLI